MIAWRLLLHIFCQLELLLDRVTLKISLSTLFKWKSKAFALKILQLNVLYVHFSQCSSSFVFMGVLWEDAKWTWRTLLSISPQFDKGYILEKAANSLLGMKNSKKTCTSLLQSFQSCPRILIESSHLYYIQFLLKKQGIILKTVFLSFSMISSALQLISVWSC